MENIKSEMMKNLAKRYPVLNPLIPALEQLASELKELFRNGGTFFVAGNGGSAADADHICGEMLKGFKSLRPLSCDEKSEFERLFGVDGKVSAEKLQGGLRAISLLSHPALSSAFSNDVDSSLVFAQQLWALSRKGDIFCGISTGGNALNIKNALMAAKVKGLKTVLLTGNRHGICEKYADMVIGVPESETYMIQELHLPIYHALCLEVEAAFWSEKC